MSTSVCAAANMRFVLLILCLVGVTTAEDCSECALDFNYVCGRNLGGQTKKFINSCELRRFNCLYEAGFYEIGIEQCETAPKCQSECPADLAPVCGRDSGGKTRYFLSRCELGRYNCFYSTGFNEIGIEQCDNAPKCQSECPADFAPVCGRDSGGKTRYFLSRCELGRYNCFYSTGFNEIGIEQCDNAPKCQSECPADFAPVCGRDSGGKTRYFLSRCELGRYNCFYRTGFYEIGIEQCDNAPKCQSECPADFAPVCGRDSRGKTYLFLSTCELGRYNCFYSTDYKEIDYGACSGQSACNTDCSTEYVPVCGRNSAGETKTFTNKCSLGEYNCLEKTDFFITRDGVCDNTCPTVCSPEYFPVCGRNSVGEKQTFKNKCELHMMNCAYGADFYTILDGECERRCPTECSTVYFPVCARNSAGEKMTFSNSCELLKTNCVYGTDFFEISVGTCDTGSQCPSECSAIYDPICARNTRGQELSFISRFELARYNCLHLTDFKEISNGICPGQSQCNIACNSVYHPVCGRNSAGESITFPNECSIKVHNCLQNTDFVKVKDGVCNNACPKVCSAEYSPVCGRNSEGEKKTFSNRCELLKNKCVYGTDFFEISVGTCDTGSQCPSECSAIYDPVCARDSRGQALSFISRCELARYNCLHLTDFKEISNGICPGQSKCNITCNWVYLPVCGRNSAGESITFPNECSIKVHNCLQNTDFVKMKDGACNNVCPSICSTEYFPICGRNSAGEKQTFNNRCELQMRNCFNVNVFFEISVGTCDSGPQCPSECPTVYSPVCAMDSAGRMQTFNNKCELDKSNCLKSTGYFQISDGVCNTNPNPPTTPTPPTIPKPPTLPVPPTNPICPIKCKGDYNPVCGSTSIGVTMSFSTSCEMAVNNCLYLTDYTQIHEGICDHKLCPLICTADYNPVTGRNMFGRIQQFKNACELGVHNCLFNTGFLKITEIKQ